LRGDDRADAWLVEQLWRESKHMREQLSLELGGFDRRRFDSAGEAAQDEPCRELVGACPARAAKTAAAWCNVVFERQDSASRLEKPLDDGLLVEATAHDPKSSGTGRSMAAPHRRQPSWRARASIAIGPPNSKKLTECSS
jgi:hypothetical protein